MIAYISSAVNDSVKVDSLHRS